MRDRLIELLRCIYGTCDEELDGSVWDVEAARVAEMVLRGEPIEAHIQQYLSNSPDCREEFMALVAIMKAEFNTQSETQEN